MTKRIGKVVIAVCVVYYVNPPVFLAHGRNMDKEMKLRGRSPM